MAATRAAAPRPGYGEVLGAAARGAYGSIRYGLPYQAKRLSGDLTPDDEAFYQRGLEEAAQASSRAAPAGVEDLTSGRVGFGRFVGENLVASLPYMAGMLAGGVAGGVAGGPGGAVAGAILGGTPQFSATNVARAVEEEGSLSEGAAVRSLATAPAQAAADALIGRFLPGAGKLLGDIASTQTGGFLRRTATSMVKAAGTEAVTEAAQQVGERYAAGLPLNDQDAAGEYVNAAVTALAVGGVLGAGGGFRRTPAVGKPASTVTEDDTVSHVEGVLDGTLRASPLALPAPSQFGRSDTATTILTDASGRSAYTPNLEPTRLDAQSMSDLDIFRSREVSDPATLANMPRPSNRLDLQEEDTLNAALRQFQAAQQPDPTTAVNVLAQPPLTFDEVVPPAATDTSVAALASMPVGEQNVVTPPAAGRPLQDVDLADLQKARRQKNIDETLATAIDEEVALRRQEDPFLGVRMNQGIAPLRGLPREEQIAGVRTLLEAGDDRAGTFALAQNLGIDTDARGEAVPAVEQVQPLESGAAVEPAPASPTAPVALAQTQPDPTFAAEWQQTLKDSGIQRLRSAAVGTPANLEDAQQRVFRALADDTTTRSGDISQVEKLARQMGLVTNDEAMDVTPLGRQVFLRSPEGLQETVSAAQQQGYTGAQASNFDRGVRAALGGAEETTFSSRSDMAAYQAGQVWAQDFVRNGDTRTAAQTEAIMARQAARATGTPVDRREVRQTLTPEQVQQQSMNRLLDLVDMRGIPDTEVAALRRMARDGATPDEVGRAIEQAQGGQVSFRQPERVPYEAPAQTVTRGQPIARDEAGQRLEGGPRLEDTRAAQRRESRQAQRKFLLQQELRAALASKDISRADFMRGYNALQSGDFRAAERILPGEITRHEGINRIADPALEQAIDGKTTLEVIDHLIATAPTPLDAGIMRAVKTAAELMEKIGVPINFTVAHDGTEVPSAMVDGETRALTWARHNPARVDIWINGSDLGSQTGMNWETVAHELIHGVTLGLVTDAYRDSSQYQNTQTGRAVQELERLTSQIEDFIQQRLNSNAELTPFEQRFLNGEINAFSDVNEIISWGLTNPDMQQYLDSIPYTPELTMWDKFVDLLRKIFRLPPSNVSALDALLHVSEALITAPEAEVRNAWARNQTDDTMAPMRAAPTVENISAANRTAQAANTSIQQATSILDRITSGLNLREGRAKFRKAKMKWSTHNHLDREYGQQVPALLLHHEAVRRQAATRAGIEQMFVSAHTDYENLQQASPNQAKWVSQLMAAVAEFRLDPSKTWDEHTWIDRGVRTDAAGKTTIDADAQNDAARLERVHAKMVDMANKLKRGEATGWKVFQDRVALNDALGRMRMAAMLHHTVAGDAELSLGMDQNWANPVDAFIDADIAGAQNVQAYWEKTLDGQVAQVTDFLREKRGELQRADAKDRQAGMQQVMLVEQQLDAIADAKKAMARTPYFHLGRFGDYFGSATIRKLENGQVDPVAQQAVAKALADAGLTDAQISTDSTKPRFMMRMDTEDQKGIYDAIITEMEQKGFVEKGSAKSGPRTQSDNYGVADSLSPFVANYITKLESNPAFQPDDTMSDKEKQALATRKQAMIQLARDTFIESQSDFSISKVMARRHEIPGFSPDMERSFLHRGRIGAANIANIAAAPKFDEVYRGLAAQYQEAVVVNPRDDAGNPIPRMDPGEVLAITRELKLRDATNPVQDTADWLDKGRALAHSYYLGFSPASALVDMSQLGVVVLPELAKKHGYRKSFQAMRQAAPQALAILRAAHAEARALGWKHWGDATITNKVLRNAGLSKEDQAFVRHLIATSSIDLGSMSRALARVVSGDKDTKLENYLNLSSGLRLYSEMFSRLTSGLAARKLHGGYDAAARDYAAFIVNEAMFDFQNTNTARALGRQGILGGVTPMLVQFQSFSIQMLEKLYSEIRNVAGSQRPGETAAQASLRRKEAATFLAGHLTAVTALAGTLGLPFATVGASVLERLVDAFDDDEDPFDATAAYRNFLADVFGKEVGAVVSRGLPRALGFDVSRRVGEQDIIPFSSYLADRRSWKETLNANIGQDIGAVPSMVLNILDGGQQLMDGDFLGGSKTMLPIAFKNPLEAYRMSEEGYIDTRGNKLPLSPTASSYLWQLIGFGPAAKAEYSEARGDASARRGEIGRRADTLRQGIIRNIRQGNNDAARDLIQEAMRFDADTGSTVVSSLRGAIEKQNRDAALARTLSIPAGVSLRDVAGMQQTRYANF